MVRVKLLVLDIVSVMLCLFLFFLCKLIELWTLNITAVFLSLSVMFLVLILGLLVVVLCVL